jgi:hypothetical protein
MDSKPLVHGLIAFQPKANGRESFAYTDAEGKYDLKYKDGVMGAGIGENSVRISHQRTPDPRTEAVPPKYSNPQKTTLHYEVKPGDNNDVNFDLLSK